MLNSCPPAPASHLPNYLVRRTSCAPLVLIAKIAVYPSTASASTRTCIGVRARTCVSVKHFGFPARWRCNSTKTQISL